MLKKILLSVSVVSMIIVGTSFATVNNTMTTKGYVDTEIDKKQLTIPAAGTAGVGAGETVVTYTATAGEIGERALFTGGTYNAANDADKLITASALKSAFTLPETQTTKLTCANPGTCNLWTITNQTAYGKPLRSIQEWLWLVRNKALGRCYKGFRDGAEYYYTRTSTAVSFGRPSTCSTRPERYGDWGVAVGDDIIHPDQLKGISACSSLGGKVKGQPASNQAVVQDNYYTDMMNAPTSRTSGGVCYCKLIYPEGSTAGWVYLSSPGGSNCASSCAGLCAQNVQRDDAFKTAIFGLVQ